MDFGDILNEWDTQREQNRKKKKKERAAQFEKLIDHYLPDDDVHTQKDAPESAHINDRQAFRRRELKEMAPEATLDLHGYRVNEAIVDIERFLKTSRAQGLSKVLIIHGKGNHSGTHSVLDKAVRNHVERSAIAGEFGFADRKQGGRGATWVILR